MKFKLILIAAMFTSTLLTAQDEPNKEVTSNKIKVYTPTGQSTTNTSKDNSYKWAVKTDVLGIISGEFPLIAEYRIAKKFSVEGSAGITYAYIANDFSLSGDDDYYFEDETKAALGSAFRGTFKFYPSSDYDAIEGWSFGIQLFTKTTNREYDTEYYNGTTYVPLSGKKDSKTKTGVSLVIGKQIFEDSNITFEAFFGVGIANITRDYYNVVDLYDGNGEYIGTELKEINTKKSQPNIQLGFKIGFGN